MTKYETQTKNKIGKHPQRCHMSAPNRANSQAQFNLALFGTLMHDIFVGVGIDHFLFYCLILFACVEFIILSSSLSLFWSHI